MEEIILPTGRFTLEELTRVLNAFPAEISYIDKDDNVRYFNDKDKDARFFSRPLAALGKDMRVCHPKRVLAEVEALLADFKSGRKDTAVFVRNLGSGLLHIAYYALKDETGAYTGTLEVVQDISGMKDLEAPASPH
jgi:uncharacterized protein